MGWLGLYAHTHTEWHDTQRDLSHEILNENVFYPMHKIERMSVKN